MQILLLETESIIRRDIVVQLLRLGFRVNTSPEGGNYDCIIVGSINYIEVLWKKYPGMFEKSIFLFMLTSKTSLEDIAASLLQPVFFIEKPFTNESLEEVLLNISRQCNSYPPLARKNQSEII